MNGWPRSKHAEEDLTDLASVNIILCKPLFGCVALRANIVATQFLERGLARIDVPTVNTYVGCKLFLASRQFAAEPGGCRLFVKPLDIDWALTSYLQHQCKHHKKLLEAALVTTKHTPTAHMAECSSSEMIQVGT